MEKEKRLPGIDMSFVVAIPSYKRSDQIFSKTLDTLKRGNVPSENIFIFVVSEEADLYRTACPGYQIIIGVLGLIKQREFIQSYFPLDTYICMMDDDITDILSVTSEKTKDKISDLPNLIAQMKHQMIIQDSMICGIYPCDNLKFSFNNSQITSDFRYIVGAFYIIKNIRDSDLLPTSDILEDTERTVLYWKKYKKLLRFNHIIIKTKYFGKGGLESNDRLARHSTSAHILVDRHPNLLRLKDCRGYADAKCRRLKKIVSLE